MEMPLKKGIPIQLVSGSLLKLFCSLSLKEENVSLFRSSSNNISQIHSLEVFRICFALKVAPSIWNPKVRSRRLAANNKWVGNSYLWTYDLFGPVCNVFDGGKSITRTIGRVWPWKSRLFWAPKQHERSESCLGPKKSNTLHTGPYQSEVHR